MLKSFGNDRFNCYDVDWLAVFVENFAWMVISNVVKMITNYQ